MVQGRRCWFCGELDLPLTDEHVLSQENFGGRLEASRRVCAPCNREAGRLEHLVATTPPLVQYVGKAATALRPKRPRFPEMEAILPDGARGRAALTPEGTRIVSWEPRQIGMEGDVEVWEVAEGEEEKFERRRLARGQRVRAVGRPLGEVGYMQLTRGMGVEAFELWPRFAAKVALGCASLVLPETWLDSRGARALQDLFQRGHAPKSVWRGRLKLPFPWLPELDAESLLAQALHPHEHILAVSKNEQGEGALVEMIFFGAVLYRIDLFDAECPDDEPAWLLSPSGPAPVREPWEMLYARLLARLEGRELATVHSGPLAGSS